jgi:hypothetical protein
VALAGLLSKWILPVPHEKLMQAIELIGTRIKPLVQGNSNENNTQFKKLIYDYPCCRSVVGVVRMFR